MVTKLMPGDTVNLNAAVYPYKQYEVAPIGSKQKPKEFWEAEPNEADSKQPPHTLFGAHVGIYLGECRKRVRDGRAHRGVVRRLYQKFFFGETEVMIDPKNVDILFAISEIKSFDSDNVNIDGNDDSSA